MNIFEMQFFYETPLLPAGRLWQRYISIPISLLYVLPYLPQLTSTTAYSIYTLICENLLVTTNPRNSRGSGPCWQVWIQWGARVPAPPPPLTPSFDTPKLTISGPYLIFLDSLFSAYYFFNI